MILFPAQGTDVDPAASTPACGSVHLHNGK
jgi:hypothetical protein